ncbi:hypothetical protein AAE02nite_02000 [Adhaeribacter aerolatus]|uniref:Thioredoxin domain-containing protein n=1 Tax=Adhaeribacter aerolatus TaxID=670289 RepID=A0A512AS59_9BACT|nr:hypothetical protein AAE02nite_02000 [Adhaeribacter aerolatus]
MGLPNTITIVTERSTHHPASVSFQNEFGDYEHLSFNSDSISGQYLPLNIKSRHPGLLQVSHGSQVPAYLVTGDTLRLIPPIRYISNYAYQGKRPGEINFYQLLDQKSLGMNAGDLMGVHRDEEVFHPRVKMLNYLVNQRRALLQRVKDSLALSPEFDRFIQNEITAHYLISLLAPFYRQPYKPQPLRPTYLDTLAHFYSSGFFNQHHLVFSSPGYRRSVIFYTRFLSRASLQTPAAMETLYRTAHEKFSGQTRQYALFSLLKEHLPQNPNVAPFLELGKKDITYKPYRRYLDSLATRPKILTNNPQLLNNALTTLKGEKITWQELLARNRGKVMYVNFWASWFDLSLDQLVLSQQLQARLKESEVVFVYLSVDRPKDKVQWQQTIRARGLTQSNNQHYLINDQSPLATFITGKKDGFPLLNYLLISKTGQVAAIKARPPGDPELQNDITTLLHKE